MRGVRRNARAYTHVTRPTLDHPVGKDVSCSCTLQRRFLFREIFIIVALLTRSSLCRSLSLARASSWDLWNIGYDPTDGIKLSCAIDRKRSYYLQRFTMGHLFELRVTKFTNTWLKCWVVFERYAYVLWQFSSRKCKGVIWNEFVISCNPR